MGLTSLFLFTLLGGMAAGVYLFETWLVRERSGERPWLVSLIVVVLFAFGLVAATTHVHSIPHAIQSVFGGTVNFGAGMVHEVAIAGAFFVLALIDMILMFAKKKSPFALRVITAIVAVVFMLAMGAAYIHILGNPIWCNVPATILIFFASSLTTGLALFATIAKCDVAANPIRMGLIVSNILLAIALVLEMVAYATVGKCPYLHVFALIIAPVVSLVLLGLAKKFQKKQTLAIVISVVSIIGVALSRYAFYATWSIL